MTSAMLAHWQKALAATTTRGSVYQVSFDEQQNLLLARHLLGCPRKHMALLKALLGHAG